MKNLTTLILLFPCFVSAQTYYFATSGNDGNAGTQVAPFKTITKANTLTADTIRFNGGDIFYGALVPKSGTLGNPVVYNSYGSGKATITGFQDITGWIQAGNIWTKTIAVSSVNMVAIGNSFIPIGKYPNGSKVYIKATAATATSVTSTTLANTWTGGQVVIRKNHWIIDKATITSQSNQTLNFTNPNSYIAQSGWGFFIQNIQGACDLQNEWFFAGGKLGMFSTSSPTGVKASTIDNLVQINDKSYVKFSKLQFTGSNAATVVITSGHDIGFDSCDFNFSGINGFTVSSSAHHITLNK